MQRDIERVRPADAHEQRATLQRTLASLSVAGLLALAVAIALLVQASGAAAAALRRRRKTRASRGARRECGAGARTRLGRGAPRRRRRRRSASGTRRASRSSASRRRARRPAARPLVVPEYDRLVDAATRGRTASCRCGSTTRSAGSPRCSARSTAEACSPSETRRPATCSSGRGRTSSPPPRTSCEHR